MVENTNSNDPEKLEAVGWVKNNYLSWSRHQLMCDADHTRSPEKRAVCSLDEGDGSLNQGVVGLLSCAQLVLADAV